MAIAIPLLTSLIGLGIAANAARSSDRGAERSEGGLGTALFGYRDRALRINTPMPMLTSLPFEDASGRRKWRPGISLELFRAKF